MISLFHVSGWALLATATIGIEFVLVPGPQHAEGPGVYFSEGSPVPSSTAEGSHDGVAAIVHLATESHAGWWRTKSSLARKFGRARTWHSDSKSIRCVVRRVDVVNGSRLLDCEWSFVET
jgi:hypothetical protein